MTINDITDIKTKNLMKILIALRSHEGLTKNTLTKMTDLSFATISNLCNELIDKGILIEEKVNKYSVGRTPNEISLNCKNFYIICLNLQMQNVIGFAVMDLKNNIHYKHDYDISAISTVEELVAYLKEIYDVVITDLNIKNVIGLGIAVSGVYDITNSRVINCAVEMYENQPLKKMFEDVFQVPVYVDNESNLCVMTMQRSTYPCNNIIYIHISEGVGVGIISEGNLLRGKNGYGAEISHIPLGSKDIQCHICGNYGCVENELSIKGFVRKYFHDSLSADTLGKWNAFVKRTRENKTDTQHVLHKNAVILGRLVTILIQLFDPEILYIGGTISEIYESIRQPMMEEIQRRCPTSMEKGLTIHCDYNSELSIFEGICEVIFRMWSSQIA